MYIHEHKEWPTFSWDKELVGTKLNKVHQAAGYLMGHLSVIGFNDKMSAVVESISHDVIASSEIEGVALNNEQVRSSVARQLGVPLHNPATSSRYILLCLCLNDFFVRLSRMCVQHSGTAVQLRRMSIPLCRTKISTCIYRFFLPTSYVFVSYSSSVSSLLFKENAWDCQNNCLTLWSITR